MERACLEKSRIQEKHTKIHKKHKRRHGESVFEHFAHGGEEAFGLFEGGGSDGGLWGGEGDEGVGDFVEEMGGSFGDDLVHDASTAAMGEDESFLGAGDGDVAESSFLLDVALVDGGLVREEALLHAGDDDEWEFESLGGVDGHHGDGVALFVGLVLESVLSVLEVELLEEFAEGAFVEVCVVVVGDGAEEFEDVIASFECVLAWLVHADESVAVSESVEEFLGEGEDGCVFWESCTEFGNEVMEVTATGGGIGWDGESEDVGVEEVVEVSVRGGAEVTELLDGGVADAARGDVEDLEEREVVVRVGDESEEGGGVEDFLAFEEGVCADEDVGDSAVSEGLFEGS